MPETRDIALEKIKIPEVRLSSILDDEQRTFLAASLKEVGVINDPVVRSLGDGTYELIAGKSRIVELVNIGAQTIQCKVLETDKKTALKMNIIENVARGTYDYISMAESIRELQKEGATVEEICRTFNRSPTWVRRTLALLEIPEVYQDALKDGRLTPTHIQTALEMPTAYEVDEALRTALDLHWNTSVLRTYVDNRLAEIEMAKQLAKQRGEEPEIPAPRPQDLIRYKQCLLCSYQYPNEQMTVLPLCRHCETLTKYITTQVGEPTKAIDIVYAALKAYYEQPKIFKPPEEPT